jgi:hypothetical protein
MKYNDISNASNNNHIYNAVVSKYQIVYKHVLCVMSGRPI